MSFTKGPWIVIPANDYHGDYVEDLDGNTICDCYFIDRCGEMHKHADSEANARLIAAARDSVALAHAVASHFADTDAPLGQMARAFLAKAVL